MGSWHPDALPQWDVANVARSSRLIGGILGSRAGQSRQAISAAQTTLLTCASADPIMTSLAAKKVMAALPKKWRRCSFISMSFPCPDSLCRHPRRAQQRCLGGCLAGGGPCLSLVWAQQQLARAYVVSLLNSGVLPGSMKVA